MTDQRRQYRTFAPPEDLLRVSVSISTDPRAPDSRYAPVRVVDLSAAGMGLVVDPSVIPELKVGSMTVLRLESPHLEGPLREAVVVEHAGPGEGGNLYGVQFVDWMGLLARIPVEIADFFNRRQDYRVEPDPRYPVEVTVRDMPPTFEVRAFVRDISESGFSFVTLPLAEPMLREVRYIRSILRFADRRELMVFVARIRHRDLIGKHICFGAIFDPEATRQFPEKQIELRRFIDHVSSAHAAPAVGTTAPEAHAAD